MAIVFSLPANYEAPEGETFEALVTLTKNEDGTVTLDAIDGLPLEEADPEVPEATEEAPEGEAPPASDDSFLGAVEAQFQ